MSRARTRTPSERVLSAVGSGSPSSRITTSSVQHACVVARLRTASKSCGRQSTPRESGRTGPGAEVVQVRPRGAVGMGMPQGLAFLRSGGPDATARPASPRCAACRGRGRRGIRIGVVGIAGQCVCEVDPAALPIGLRLQEQPAGAAGERKGAVMPARIDEVSCARTEHVGLADEAATHGETHGAVRRRGACRPEPVPYLR